MSSDYITNKFDEPLFNCQICGTPEPAFYIRDTRERLIRNRTCFTCDFWIARLHIHWANPEDSFIWNGTAYLIRPDSKDGAWKGHGGRPFNITRNNGVTVTSRNVWCQGDVPDHFRWLLRDDAVVV